MRKVFILLFLTALLLTAAIVGLSGCADNNAAMRSSTSNVQPAVSHMAISPAVPANSIAARGLVQSVQRRNIYSLLGSLVERIYVKEGDKVSEGQILGVLDTADFVNQANTAEASLRMAEIGLEAARHNHQVIRNLYYARAVPREDLRQTEFAVQLALASVQQAQAMFNSARVILERSIIRSPIDGTVTAVIAREGEVGMGRLFVVEDTDNLRVTTSFREYDIARLERGMEVAITSYATGSAVYTGIINRINPAAAAFAPVVEFEAEVLVTSADTSLRIGANARLNITY